MESLPNINRVFSLIIQQERHISGNPGYNSENKTVNVGNRQNGWRQQDQNGSKQSEHGNWRP